MSFDLATWQGLAVRAARTPGERLCVLALGTAAGATGSACMSAEDLAGAAGVSRATALAAMASLRAAGLLGAPSSGGRGVRAERVLTTPHETVQETVWRGASKTVQETVQYGDQRFAKKPSSIASQTVQETVCFVAHETVQETVQEAPEAQDTLPETVQETVQPTRAITRGAGEVRSSTPSHPTGVRSPAPADAHTSADVGARVLALAPTAPALVAAAGRSRSVAKPPTDAPNLTHLVAQRMGIADAAETVCAEYHAAACVLVAAADAKAGRRFLGVVAPQPRTIYDGLAFVNDHVRGTDDWLPADAPWPEIAVFVVSVCTHALLTWGYTDPTRPDPVRLSALLRVKNGEADLFLGQLARWQRERAKWERGEEGQRRREEVRQAVQRAVQASVAADDAPVASQGHERGAQGQARETPEQRAARRAEERAAAKAAREAVAAMTDARRAAR